MSRNVSAPVEGRSGPIAHLAWPGASGRTPVLFLHPVNTAAALWGDVARHLDGERTAVAVDYRGHGRSVAAGPYLPSDYAADALTVLDAAGLRRVHVVCGSIGGAVAVELTARAPDRVASITAFGAALHIGWPSAQLDEVEQDLRHRGVEAWFRAHATDILGPAAEPGAGDALAELASRGGDGVRDIEVVVAATRATFGAADSRPTAQMLPRPLPPTRVFVGSHDPTCPIESAQELADLLDGDVHTIPGIGHLPMLEDPRGTAEKIRAFLTTVPD